MNRPRGREKRHSKEEDSLWLQGIHSRGGGSERREEGRGQQLSRRMCPGGSGKVEKASDSA